MRKIFLLLMMLALLCPSALAASVTYEGGAERFVFLPESTDLFEGFKNLLPGDALSESIRVQNDSGAAVRIYLRAEPVDEADADFLNQLHMTVTSGSKEIFDAPAGVQDGLAKNVLLGSFKQGGGTSLEVTLELPVELGNAYMDRTGTIPWVFLAEEVSTEGTPETGDSFRPALWCGIAALIVACIARMLLHRRRAEKP